MRPWVLLCDLSLAPDITVALACVGERIETIGRFPCINRLQFDGHMRDFLNANGNPPLQGAAFSARGWEQHDGLHLVGVDFTIDRAAVRELLDVQRVNFVNNFVARALAVPRLKRSEKLQVSGGEVNDHHAITVLGPHYGLGLAALVSDGADGWTALHGEGGHSDLPVKTEAEWRLVEAIRARTGYVSRESVISVNGLTDIYLALHAVAGETCDRRTSSQIIAAARQGDARSREAIDYMTGWLAAMASDMALIMGASGGVYLTGALLDMVGDLFDVEAFRQRYLDKGPRSGYVAEIPVFRTLAPDMELKGLATLFE